MMFSRRIKDIKYLSLLFAGIIIGGFIVYGCSNVKKDEQVSLKTCPPCPQNSSDLAAAAAYLKFKEIKASFFPSGIPDGYGQELNISFDRVQDAINKVRVYGPTYGTGEKKIILTGADLKRYTNIGSQTSCQYCCRVKTLVREDGKAACGCAHSIMMRGLAAYMIRNHPELSDEQILEELNMWKIAYFPKQTLTARLQEMEKAGEEGIKEILEEFPDFLPKMVGGC